MVSYATMRDVMHIVCPSSQDKHSKILQNRIKILRKSITFLGHGDNSQAQFVISNLSKLPGIAQYFLPFRTKISEQAKRIGFFRYSKNANDFTKIFIYLVDYLLKHQKEVQNCFQGNYANIDYFNQENLPYYREQIVPFQKVESFYKEPVDQYCIRKVTLTNTVHGALVYKKEHLIADVSKGISLQAYKVYQRFSNEILKNLIEEMRRYRMIQMRKRKGANFFHSYRLSLNYITVQNVPWWYETMESAYKTFLHLKYDQKMCFDTNMEFSQRTKFGQLIGVNEVLTFQPLSNIDLNIKYPEYHLVLNPDIEDHSEVIDELAKRYHAKCLIELKGLQKPPGSSTKRAESNEDDEDDVEMVEIFDPQPSTSKQQPETVEKELDAINLDEDEPLDLSISAKESAAIDNLKHWISDCIDLDRVRSPSPELFNFDSTNTEIKTEQEEPVDIKEENEEPKKLLSVEEIIKEMLNPSTDCKEPRTVPYISDLVNLLFTIYEEGDIKTDETKSLALIKKHFVKQYPRMENVSVKDIDRHYLADYIENRTSIKDVWVNVERESYVEDPSDKAVAFNEIYAKGGDVQDLTTAYELLEFIEEQGMLGAAGYEIKEKFMQQEGRCTLELILQILTRHHLLLRTGVCSVRYIHFKHREPWLTETFRMTADHIAQIADGKVLDDNLVWYKMNPFPWTNIEGAFDSNVFKVWMSNVFSYCIEHPKVMFMDLCAKFCYIKPYDLFYLIEKLQEVGALELRKYVVPSENVFSEYQLPEERLASPLDKFEDMYIETHNISFTMLGSFFHNI
ncbi:uncharacterized protein LOC126749412 [Anthonomus grandis grandis]|uniref:uncharacterized protein LOC126749412 n=1 Tax=Anthonomus grandis grandis TaxID=2921223 RepID=UPI002165B200|nr:uncharacterized protein LOC126749412 [Anthonomus grandis grandis]